MSHTLSCIAPRASRTSGRPGTSLVAPVCPDGHPSAPVVFTNRRAAAAARLPALEKDVPAWFHARIEAVPLCTVDRLGFGGLGCRGGSEEPRHKIDHGYSRYRVPTPVRQERPTPRVNQASPKGKLKPHISSTLSHAGVSCGAGTRQANSHSYVVENSVGQRLKRVAAAKGRASNRRPGAFISLLRFPAQIPSPERTISEMSTPSAIILAPVTLAPCHRVWLEPV